MDRTLSYAQLLRLPNVFTALADICLGWLALGPAAGRWYQFALLLCSSACLYCGGMVWNDVFDIEQDRRERPKRPLPSGRVSVRTAVGIGVALLLTGVVFAALAGLSGQGWNRGPLAVAGSLVGCILLYDRWLKHTSAGPLGMGACRFFNVLLGLSTATAEGLPGQARFHLALVVGLYIVGVTWFARTEARQSSQAALAGAAAVMLAALILALALPVWGGSPSPLFPYLLVAYGFAIGLPAVRAIRQPGPRPVQATVKRAVLGLIALDAILATALVNWPGLLILALLPPALCLGRWVYST
jgi:4-hydroxybenzoate polyprenyltransferase